MIEQTHNQVPQEPTTDSTVAASLRTLTLCLDQLLNHPARQARKALSSLRGEPRKIAQDLALLNKTYEEVKESLCAVYPRRPSFTLQEFYELKCTSMAEIETYYKNKVRIGLAINLPKSAIVQALSNGVPPLKLPNNDHRARAEHLPPPWTRPHHILAVTVADNTGTHSVSSEGPTSGHFGPLHLRSTASSNPKDRLGLQVSTRPQQRRAREKPSNASFGSRTPPKLNEPTCTLNQHTPHGSRIITSNPKRPIIHSVNLGVDDFQPPREPYLQTTLSNIYQPSPECPSHPYNLNSIPTSPCASRELMIKEFIEQRPELTIPYQQLLYSFKDIFPINKFNVLPLNITPVKLKIISDKVISLRPYRTPYAYQKEIQDQISQLLKHDIITPSSSPYSSPVTLVRKRDNTMRLCIDFRRVNELVPSDLHPLPLIETVLNNLSKARVFSTVDISNAYYQIPIAEESQPLLPFVTQQGQYNFKRLPFVFKSAPQIFERVITQLIHKHHLSFIAHYYDDFVIFSDSSEQHLTHLRLLFKFCLEENIQLNLKKCNFYQNEIDFLGYHITAGTYTPNIKNTEIINAIRTPINVKNLQSFLGAVNVYHKFIPEYARLRHPLNQLLKKNAKWLWSPNCQQAFDIMKQHLATQPVLHLFQEGLPCQVYCDASTQGIAGVLKQVHPDGNIYPVQYYSRALRSYERNYTISELECLAIVECVDKFRVYLLSTRCVIYSDHHALQWLKTIKDPTGRLFRWSLRLSAYDYEVKYLKGSRQYEADLLSRNPFCGFLSTGQIKDHQGELRRDTRYILTDKDLMTITRRGVTKIIVPPSLRGTLLQRTHRDFNHPGISQMTRMISAQYYWDGMTNDIRTHVRTCSVCQLVKPPKGPIYGELGQLPPAVLPYELVSLDTISGFAKYVNFQTFLHAVVDHATRYAWAFPSRSTSILTYTQMIKKVMQFGSPKRLLTDRAPAFTYPKFRRFLIRHNIGQLLTTSNNHQANGLSSFPIQLSEHVQNYPKIDDARELAYQRTHERQLRDKARFDQTHRASDFEVGDLVLAKTYHHPDTGKLAPFFSGPYEILEIISPQIVRINRSNRPLSRETDTIHVNKLKHYTETEKFISPPPNFHNLDPARQARKALSSLRGEPRKIAQDLALLNKTYEEVKESLCAVYPRRPSFTLQEFYELKCTSMAEIETYYKNKVRIGLAINLPKSAIVQALSNGVPPLKLPNNDHRARAEHLPPPWTRPHHILAVTVADNTGTHSVSSEGPTSGHFGPLHLRSTASSNHKDRLGLQVSTRPQQRRAREKPSNASFGSRTPPKLNEPTCTLNQHTPHGSRIITSNPKRPIIHSVNLGVDDFQPPREPYLQTTLSNIYQPSPECPSHPYNLNSIPTSPCASRELMIKEFIEQRPELTIPYQQLLYSFKDIFPINKFNVLPLNITPVKLKIISDKVISLRPYRTPYAYQKEIQDQISQLLKHDIITPSSSPYSSPVTLVRKRDNTMRLCIDFRRVNELVPSDLHPLPLIETVLNNLSKARVFSTVDISNAYYQIPIAEESQPLLPFVTQQGQYNFKRLPFVFKSAPQIFERVITQLIHKHHLSFIAHYYDDFVIFSDSSEQHLTHLRLLFKFCLEENIQLNLKKCNFYQNEIDFLGYHITAGTYTPNIKNTEIINAIRTPINVKNLQSFLGAVNVYHKFIPEYARLRHPLNQLLKKNAKWLWSPNCQQAFDIMKQHLATQSVLHLFQEGLPCQVYCDASTQGIAGVLKQVHPDGNIYPVQYYSRALRSYERNYTISELECLAIVECVDKFRVYLLSTRCVIYSDHHALQWLKTIKDPTGRLFRWSLRLSAYDYEVKYLKGSRQYEADLLSRNPFCGFLSTGQIKDHQGELRRDTRYILTDKDLMTITRRGVTKIIVPPSLRGTLLQRTHRDFNHPGISQMTRMISAQYYWDGMTNDIRTHVRTCSVCQLVKPPKGPIYGELGQLPPAVLPYELVSLDTISGFAKYINFQTFLHAVVDHATRYAWAFPSRSTSILTYTQMIKKVMQFGSPKRLLTDRAPAFTYPKFRRFLIRHNIGQLLTTSNNHQANGLSSFPIQLSEHVQNYPKIDDARELAYQRTHERHLRDKARFDQTHRASDFEVGDLVLAKTYHHPDTGKLAPFFSGPYEILEIISPQIVRINRSNRPLSRETDTIHVNKLKHYTETEKFISPPPNFHNLDPARQARKALSSLRGEPRKIAQDLALLNKTYEEVKESLCAVYPRRPSFTLQEFYELKCTSMAEIETYYKNKVRIGLAINLPKSAIVQALSNGVPPLKLPNNDHRARAEHLPPPWTRPHHILAVTVADNTGTHSVSSEGPTSGHFGPLHLRSTASSNPKDRLGLQVSTRPQQRRAREKPSNASFGSRTPPKLNEPTCTLNQHTPHGSRIITSNPKRPIIHSVNLGVDDFQPPREPYLQTTLSNIYQPSPECPSHPYNLNSIPTSPCASRELMIKEFIEQRPELTIPYQQLLYSFKDIFPINKFNVLPLNITPVKLKIISDKVISLRPYRTPYAYQKEIQDQISQLLKHDIITPSSSPYSSPVTLVRKRDNTMRLCIDFRRVNELVPSDLHPLPLIETVLNNLSKARVFSTVDISNAYYQIPIAEESQPLLPFVTQQGQYNFKRLPFVFKSAPQIFERVITQLIHKHHLSFIAHYYDDFVIFSDSSEQHLTHLRLLFKFCLEENIQLNLKKCNFYQNEIDFLGYHITAGTYTPNIKNTEIINAIRTPINVKNLQSFLGAVNVYHKFIPEYARLRHPLNQLLKKNAKWLWSPNCQQAFDIMKQHLATQPVRALRSYERNYTISELECLAIVECVDKFRVYLLSTRCVIYSDHHALQWLKTIKDPTGRLFRWSLRLSAYDYEVKYLKGSRQYEADLLSRNPFCGFLSTGQIKDHQGELRRDTRYILTDKDLMTITRRGVTKIIVPPSLRGPLLQRTHRDFNHPGISQMTRMISAQYYWDGMTNDIRTHVRTCSVCQLVKPPKGPIYGELGQLPPAVLPYELVSLDTISGFAKYVNFQTFLHAVVDHATRYAWAFPSRSTSILTYTQMIKKVMQFGSPKRLLTDRAPAFTYPKFRRFLIRHNIGQLLTTSNNHQANGLSSFPIQLSEHVQNYPKIDDARELAYQRTHERHLRDKARFDQTHRASDFEVGDLVLAKTYHHPDTGKLAPFFSGPYEILEIISPQIVRINRSNRPLSRETDTIHVNKLKHYTETEKFISPPYHCDLKYVWPQRLLEKPRNGYLRLNLRNKYAPPCSWKESGKLQLADRVATNSSAGIQECRNLRLFVTDKNTGLRFLVDSGADISIIPPKDKDRMPSSNFKLYAANGTEIVTYQTKVRKLDIGHRRQFQCPLVIANTNRDIIGADFLYTFGLAEFQYILNNGIIRPSNSPCDSPLHLVSKNDESLRPCGDYRRLNEVTLPDRYPIPRLDDFHHILKGTRVYSKIDLCKAFYQIPIAEEDKPKTAIITHFGLFEFNIEEAEVQFEQCKQALAKTALLAYPDAKLPISLCTDASDRAVGNEKSSPRQSRHLQYISQYTTEIKYIKGTDNIVADALSKVDAITTIDYEEITKEQTGFRNYKT
ncbi:hypothetical protein LAZ67_2003305 [Cordylochernes scorpioides]|uniref:RNA-directed DNA polymerase n=1 Tax=Cordylochernes scorpioides TaxID=51811 RepID=A0ABY6K5Y2_9ARAC|nr:hypothetical protein LAZ67_2003305 [Cordylochernes scorpioides]